MCSLTILANNNYFTVPVQSPKSKMFDDDSSECSFNPDPDGILVEEAVHTNQAACVDSWVAVKVPQKYISSKGRNSESHRPKVFVGRV
jgi:hypothetical protein